MKHSKIKAARIVSLCLLTISLFVCADFLLNYLAAAFLEDGSIACTSVLHSLFGVFGDHGWTIHGFYNAFSVSLWVALLVGVENIALACYITVKSNRSQHGVCGDNVRCCE